MPPIVLSVRDLSRLRAYGYFNFGLNEFGLSGEISIDQRHVIHANALEDWTDVLDTLCHEAVHAWEHAHHPEKAATKRNYHSVGFRQKAEELGLLVDSQGRSIGHVPSGPFLKLLEKHSVNVPAFDPRSIQIAVKAPTKLKLWICSCPKPIRLRIARKDVRIRCEDCGQPFFMPPP